jgi:multisubunit Na+/H+ antiporter MnhB subunit
MEYSNAQIGLTGLIVGALAGLLVTMLLTVLWPKGKLRLLRPVVSAGLGALVAYLIIRFYR